MNELHVVPTDDLIQHEDSESCVCMPTPEFAPGGVVLVHHSLDGRELREG